MRSRSRAAAPCLNFAASVPAIAIASASVEMRWTGDGGKGPNRSSCSDASGSMDLFDMMFTPERRLSRAQPAHGEIPGKLHKAHDDDQDGDDGQHHGRVETLVAIA